MGNKQTRKKNISKKNTPELEGDFKGFGGFLIDVRNNLTNENIRKIMTAFDFKPVDRDKVERSKDPGLDFVHILKERGIISKSDITALTEKLRDLDLHGIADEITKSFSRWVHKTNHLVNEFPLEGQASGENSGPGSIHSFGEPPGFDADEERRNDGSRETDFQALCAKLGINMYRGKKLTMVDSMIVKESHSTGENYEIVDNFIRRLASYDHRAQQMHVSMEIEDNKPEEVSEAFNWDDVLSPTSVKRDKSKLYSTRDMMYVILNCLDPFLRQDILTKMAACQLAVPVLLQDMKGKNATMLLWGLRKISKSWCIDPSSSTIKEEVVVKCPFLSIAALRIGNLIASKSNILNKFLGPALGNDEHPFFTSFEQDSHPSVLSQGTLECVWYLPGNEKGTLTSPFALFNLRGDSVHYTSQANFAIELSFVVILFIETEITESYRNRIEKIASYSHVIVVIQQRESAKVESKTMTHLQHSLTFVYSGGLSALEIGKEISKMIKTVIRQATSIDKRPLEEALNIAKKLHLRCDEEDEECSIAKTLALKVKEEIQSCTPSEYKKRYLLLQQFWKEWSLHEKNPSWTKTGNVEYEKAIHEEDQNKRREAQFKTKLDSHMQKICNFLLSASPKSRDYFISWLGMYLNDISAQYLKPLTKELTLKSFARRELSNKIHQLESDIRDQKCSAKDESEIKKLKEQEKNLNSVEANLIKQFDENALGLEHIIREFGQFVESYYFANHLVKLNKSNLKRLPKVVAKMLLEGHPLEILDGDAANVPLVWLKAVFQALVNLVRNEAKIYVISVLGIQSSGKSTLLNSMFGVRFATSAGRCTRGVFLQLLPVEESLASKLHCDFIAIVDTEGLRAPEKTLSPYTEQDNELATFALCISDLTLINIGGQTMGEDMTNVLQIAAHAFVRMKEVDLNPECRIVQQFVADVTAEQKNESAMQTIIMKLDEAACEAAKREGKEHIYRQFSDIFTLQNYDTDLTNIQYIPSLWRGFMAAPDYQYSVRVQQLKSTILKSIEKREHVGLTLPEFLARIEDVWTAILKEDFVFSFQNTKEVSLYQEVMLFYRKEIQPIRGELLEMELSAKNAVACARPNAIDSTVHRWMLNINRKLAEECDKVSKNLEEKFSEKRYLIVKKYDGYFQADLKKFQTQIEHSIQLTLIRNSELTKSEHQKSSVVQCMKKKFHEDFAQYAKELRLHIDKNLSQGPQMKSTENIISDAFKEKWKEMLEEVKKDHPSKTLEDTYGEIETTILNQIIQDVSHTDISMEVNEFIKHPLRTYSSTTAKLGDQAIQDLKLLFTDISVTKDELFKELVYEIKILAKNHKMFTDSSVKALEILKKCLPKDFSNGDLNFLLLYMCSIFVTTSHESEQLENMKIILSDKRALKKLCVSEKIMPQHLIQKTFLAIVAEQFFGSTEISDKDIKLELEKKEDDINMEKLDSNPVLSKIVNLVTNQKKTTAWFSDYVEILKTSLVSLEDKHDGKICTEPIMREYVKCAKKHISDRILVSKRLRMYAVKIAYKMGLQRFTDSFTKHLKKHVTITKYLPNEDDSRGILSLQRKVVYMRDRLNELFPQESTIKPVLNVTNIWNFSDLPPTFSFLRKLDPCFIDMVRNISAEKMQFVIDIVNKIKISILTRAKPNTDFNASSFVTDIGKLIDLTEPFSKQVQASCIVHVAAWALPIYARCQFDYEKTKNITFHVAQDEKVFKTEFMSLSSICQDEAVAERCFEVMQNAILDGLIDKLYPLLYSSSLEMNNEFQNKKIFIGCVLKDLFLNKNYHGISELLHDFETFGQNWILDFHAEKYLKNPSFLQSKLTSCFNALIEETKTSIEKTSTDFEGKNLTDWITLFTSTFQTTTKLSCDQNKVALLINYLNVTDFKLLSDRCLSYLNEFQEKTDLSCHLPNLYKKESIKTWMIDVLPKQLNADIFDSFKGCNEQCPFCGTVCDHSLTEHPKHESTSHFPSGLNGWRNKYTKKLCIDICNSAVESAMRYRIPGPREAYRPYKEYETDYPTWKIRGQMKGEPSKFWKRIFVLFNKGLAEKYVCNKGDIPNNWHSIKDEEALTCLCAAYNV